MTIPVDLTSQAAGSRPAPGLPNRAVNRQGRTDHLRRARAAAQVLRIAFPQLDQLRIELRFRDASSISPTSQVHTLYPPARAFFVYPCPHSDCDGEFELGDIIRRALSGGTLVVHGALVCTGDRLGGRNSKRACALQVAYSIAGILR
jgi:hypothetical protein